MRTEEGKICFGIIQNVFWQMRGFEYFLIYIPWSNTFHSCTKNTPNLNFISHAKLASWQLTHACGDLKNQFLKKSIDGPLRKFKNLAKKWKILKFFLMCIWTQVWLKIISKKILKFFIFGPNFCCEAWTQTVTKKFFVVKIFVW